MNTLGQELKKLRTKHKLYLKDVVADFSFPHKTYIVKDSPITLQTLARYEDGSRKVTKAMYEALKRHIESK